MASKYVAMDASRREVPVTPYAHMVTTSARLGFVCAPYYTVFLDWLSMAGESLSSCAPDYSGFDLRAARSSQNELAGQMSCQLLNT